MTLGKIIKANQPKFCYTFAVHWKLFKTKPWQLKKDIMEGTLRGTPLRYLTIMAWKRGCKLERYHGFIIQHIENKTQFEEKISSTAF